MNSREELDDFLKNGHKQYLSHVSIDSVIFGYHDQQLKILLLRWKGLNGWGLPGGFIQRREPLSQAALRILRERTGLDNIFLQQFHVFGDSPYRLRERSVEEIADVFEVEVDSGHWFFERTLSIAYFALVDYARVSVTTDFFTEAYQWCDVKEIPQLLFDQNEVVEKALATLRLQMYHQPIGYNLLPEKFTLPEIHSLYETILGKKLDPWNFGKKLVNLGLIKRLSERRSIGAHRSPYLYQFEKEVYEHALTQGIIHTY
ncbi:NUDIX hydrolase [Dyadobacter pollutisoli]|jgi:ADP-ribose pyrophosphatase YjhB (NUDIX family)|uniref:NUDIX domain-containing protein n=1 Tax=Dyadobacter pollutisoli TaxID=2910158 RepID=A0A9E8NDV3_9BACT|nr:NUDIX domain-containing protein [Dyadobacter pollutisoli]WAC12701.1 NUDIX domain-containing protein [Dyadobacter pollutisoli]